MAGDWIKVEHATADKAEVLRIAELLGISRRECLGLLFDFWIWLDRNCHASVTLLSRKSLDDVTHTSGFAACLEEVGWAKFDDKSGRLKISHFDRHNGNSAKTRALANERQSRKRHANVTVKPLPEKRREEVKPPYPPTVDNFNGHDSLTVKAGSLGKTLKSKPIPLASDPDGLARYGEEVGLKARVGEDPFAFRERLFRSRGGGAS